MGAMGGPLPEGVTDTRKRVTAALKRAKCDTIDAASATTGKDFLVKIWRLAVARLAGIAVVHEGIRSETLANVYYALGWMQAYGRETVVIKVGDVRLPSDLVRTEYIALDERFPQGLWLHLACAQVCLKHRQRL